VSYRSEPKRRKMTEYYRILHNGKPINCTLPQPGRDLSFEAITLKQMKLWEIWELLGY